jgi:hypothetical protein
MNPTPFFLELPMGWVFLEVLAALAIAVGIVWWTLPRKPKQAAERADSEGNDGASEAAKDPPQQG